MNRDRGFTVHNPFLPADSGCGLQGAELTCRWTTKDVGVMLKEAWRAILALLKSWLSTGCTAPGREPCATFTAFSTENKSEIDGWLDFLILYAPGGFSCKIICMKINKYASLRMSHLSFHTECKYQAVKSDGCFAMFLFANSCCDWCESF